MQCILSLFSTHNVSGLQPNSKVKIYGMIFYQSWAQSKKLKSLPLHKIFSTIVNFLASVEKTMAEMVVIGCLNSSPHECPFPSGPKSFKLCHFHQFTFDVAHLRQAKVLVVVARFLVGGSHEPKILEKAYLLLKFKQKNVIFIFWRPKKAGGGRLPQCPPPYKRQKSIQDLNQLI